MACLWLSTSRSWNVASPANDSGPGAVRRAVCAAPSCLFAPFNPRRGALLGVLLSSSQGCTSGGIGPIDPSVQQSYYSMGHLPTPTLKDASHHCAAAWLRFLLYPGALLCEDTGFGAPWHLFGVRGADTRMLWAPPRDCLGEPRAARLVFLEGGCAPPQLPLSRTVAAAVVRPQRIAAGCLPPHVLSCLPAHSFLLPFLSQCTCSCCLCSAGA